MQSTNGKISRRHENHPSVTRGLDDEQTLADLDQTLVDADQTLADTDQTSAERDQRSAESDQVASDRDQAASDRDLAHGVDPGAHDVSRDIRQRTTREREQSADARLLSATERDSSAHVRDVAALARDRAAAGRDLAMAQRDAEYDRDGQHAVTGAEIVMRAAAQRKRAAWHRAEAAEHRAQAAVDREAAALDREQGARDRRQALADRETLARALKVTEHDSLTGARTRAAGLADLDHEVDRCRRTGSTLVVVCIDVVGLNSLNDTDGHDAGDDLLKRVVTAIQEHVRSYDLIIRVGDDEFLCAISNVMLADMRERFGAIASALASSSESGAIRTGFAQLTATETATELVARADSRLIDSRHGS